VGSLIFIILAFLCGGITIVSMIINARLAQEIGTLQGGFINYTVGLLVTMLVLLIIMFTGNFTTGTLTGIPFYAFLGGFVGVMVVIASNIVIPRIPAIYTTILIFIGQIFTGIILDYFRLGSISIGKIIGGLLIIIGMLYNSYLDNKSLVNSD